MTLIDQTLFRFDQIWAAAGHPHAVFRLQPNDLVRLSGAPVADVVQTIEAEPLLNATKSEAASTHLAGVTGENSPSPCISVCRMDPLTNLCEGCYRTMGEILYWGSANETTRRAILALIEQRRAAAGTKAPRRWIK